MRAESRIPSTLHTNEIENCAYIVVCYNSEPAAIPTSPHTATATSFRPSRWRLRPGRVPSGRARRGGHADSERSAVVHRRDALERSGHFRAALSPQHTARFVRRTAGSITSVVRNALTTLDGMQLSPTVSNSIATTSTKSAGCRRVALTAYLTLACRYLNGIICARVIVKPCIVMAHRCVVK